MMDRTSFALEDFRNIQDLIKFIDQKAGAVLLVFGFILTAFIDFARDMVIISPKGANAISIVTFIAGLVLVVDLIYQIYFILFKVIDPQKAKNYCSNEKCLFYFEHIASMEKEHFMKQFSDMDEDDIEKEILGQVYEVAKILDNKRNNFCISLRHLYGSAILLLVFILLTKCL